MSDNDNQKIYDRFNDDVQYMIVYAKAASINAKVEYIYPESFVIGLLTMGINDVSKALVKHNIDLEQCLKSFKDKLEGLKSKKVNGSVNNYDNIRPNKVVKEICQFACSIGDELKHDNVGVQHIFLSILQTCPDIQKIFEEKGLKMPEFSADMRKIVEVKPNNDTKTKHATKRKNGSALEVFCVDMTKEAEENKYDPIISRDSEIEEAITILCRRNKSNPILVGEPGVGKTAIVEGICQRIISKTVPKKLRESKIYSLNVGVLVAGTKYRGEFENRLQSIIKELKENPNYIIFIDEIHNVVGAGSASGSVDAANMLKPALAKGLKCLGATTNAEHKKIFSGDGALDRRFEKISVEEPSAEDTMRILRGIKGRLEEYHKCIVTEDAMETAVKLTKRYKPEKFFPDKAITCIDTACAKYAWKDEDDSHIVGHDIAMVISKQCKIPLEIILWDNYERVQNTENALRKNIVGQDHVIAAISRVLKNSYSGVRNPEKPIGVFVMGGESGTGKTHTAKELSKVLFDNDASFIRIDMSEYSESHSVSKITGSPPGYVGFQDADVIGDKIKNRPYCVLLLDEIDKAHPNAIKLFLQVMGEGFYTDSSGDKINCKNVIMIMTGNFGMHDKQNSKIGFGQETPKNAVDKEKERLISFCKKVYGVEFVNRVDDFLPFLPIDKNSLERIALLETEKFVKRIERKDCIIEFTDVVPKQMVKLSEKEHGINAMILDRLVSKYLEPCLADVFLNLENKPDICYTVTIDVKNDEFVANKRKLKCSIK